MEEKKSKKILANRVYSDSTLKKWKKEDLIEQIRILEHNWAAAEESLNNSAKNSEKLLAEQKAEIERLERKVKRDEERIVREMNIGYANERQAVKDTVKEILQELQEEIKEGYIPATLKIKELKERYGLEVE